MALLNGLSHGGTHGGALRPPQGKPVRWWTSENQRPKGHPRGAGLTPWSGLHTGEIPREGELGHQPLSDNHQAPSARELTLKLCHFQKKPTPAHNSTEQRRHSLLLISLFFPCLSHALEERGYLMSVQQEVRGKGSGESGRKMST